MPNSPEQTPRMDDFGIVQTPRPPYYAAIATFVLSGIDVEGYRETADHLMERARKLPGFYGEEAARTSDGASITVSYWRDVASIKEWVDDLEHTAARKKGRERWYQRIEMRIAQVERSYGFTREISRDDPPDGAQPRDGHGPTAA